MKAAIITRYFLPVKGGIENHCYNLAKQLVKRGVSVEIHTSKDTLTERNVLEGYEILSEIKVFRHGYFWKFIPENCEVVHVHNFNIFPCFWIFLKTIFVTKIFRVTPPKIIITPHGGFTPWWDEFPFIVRFLKRLFHKTIGKFFLNNVVNKIIAVSKWEKEQLIKEGINPDKIVIIPNGIEDMAYKLPQQNCKELKSYQPYLLFLGRISKIKNIDLIIKYVSTCKDINLLIAGPVHEKNYYYRCIELIKKYKLEKKVKFLGEVHGSEKYKLIDCSLAVVLVSHTESESIVVKEAMARGKPVIVSNIAELPSLIKHMKNGFIVSTKEEFTKAVEMLLNDRNIKIKISKNNKKKSEKWRWDIIASKVLEIYKQI